PSATSPSTSAPATAATPTGATAGGGAGAGSSAPPTTCATRPSPPGSPSASSTTWPGRRSTARRAGASSSTARWAATTPPASPTGTRSHPEGPVARDDVRPPAARLGSRGPKVGAHVQGERMAEGTGRDIAALVAQLTLDEKAALTAGADMWHTVSVPRLGIPAVRMTDGPNGARGTQTGPAGPASACLPCGAALGATWDPELVERVGEGLGAEARAKGARVRLAPTVNMHRSPLAGRNFECLSEDPLLAGRLAAAYVRGVQSRGVAATVKHLVGNEAEHQRYTISSDVDERPLREIYLVPFELAVREGGALGIMTSYNRLNGRWCTEQPELLRDILRDEWGFEGFVVTDWFAVAVTEASATAGVDLEMPGPGRAFGPALAAAVRDGRVDERLVDEQVTRLLTVLDRIGALDDADPGDEGGEDRPEHRAVARRAAAEST